MLILRSSFLTSAVAGRALAVFSWTSRARLRGRSISRWARPIFSHNVLERIKRYWMPINFHRGTGSYSESNTSIATWRSPVTCYNELLVGKSEPPAHWRLDLEQFLACIMRTLESAKVFIHSRAGHQSTRVQEKFKNTIYVPMEPVPGGLLPSVDLSPERHVRRVISLQPQRQYDHIVHVCLPLDCLKFFFPTGAQQMFDMYGFAQAMSWVKYGWEWEHQGVDICCPCSYFLLLGCQWGWKGSPVERILIQLWYRRDTVTRALISIDINLW